MLHQVGALDVLPLEDLLLVEGVLEMAEVLLVALQQVVLQRVVLLLLLRRRVQVVEALAVAVEGFRVLVRLVLLELEPLVALRLLTQKSSGQNQRRGHRIRWGLPWCERETKQLRSGDQNVAALPCAFVNLESK